MLTYDEAKSLFGQCRDKGRGHKLAHGTRIHMRGKSFAIRLHDTDIVIIRPDGTYRINSGGFRTTTTKRRMNSVLPCAVNLQSGVWCIGDSFLQDGMLIDQGGAVVGKSIPAKDVVKIKRRVDKYCKQFIKLILTVANHRDIGRMDLYSHLSLPRHDNEKHLKDLWGTIEHEVDVHKFNKGFVPTRKHLFKLIYLSMMESGCGDMDWVWAQSRRVCLDDSKDSSYCIKLHLSRFLRARKVTITQMILDSIIKVYPSVSEAENILEQELALAS